MEGWGVVFIWDRKENLEVPKPDECLATHISFYLLSTMSLYNTGKDVVPQDYASCSDVAALENLIGWHDDGNVSGKSTVGVNWNSITGETVGLAGGCLSASFLTLQNTDIIK